MNAQWAIMMGQFPKSRIVRHVFLSESATPRRRVYRDHGANHLLVVLTLPSLTSSLTLDRLN